MVNLTSSAGSAMDNVNVTIMVYKNATLAGTYYCLSNEGWIVNLDEGVYLAVISVENQGYDVNQVNATVTVTNKELPSPGNDEIRTVISSKPVSTVYNGGKYLTVNLTDIEGNPIGGAVISVNLNGIKTRTTGADGKVRISTNGLAPKTYTAKIVFEANGKYAASSASVKVTVKKATPKMTASKKTFKSSTKTKKYTVTLKANGNALKKAKVSLKVNGKTYKAKTNSKGKATFKITKLTKKGKFTSTVKYDGSKCYNKLTKKVKLTIR